MNDGERRVEQALRFSKIWWQSRADAEKSQEYMALGLGVSKKTIQNWEKGIAAPNLYQGIEWFQLLGLNPMHYYLEFLYPSLFGNKTDNDEDKKLEDAPKPTNAADSNAAQNLEKQSSFTNNLPQKDAIYKQHTIVEGNITEEGKKK